MIAISGRSAYNEQRKEPAGRRMLPGRRGSGTPLPAPTPVCGADVYRALTFSALPVLAVMVEMLFSGAVADIPVRISLSPVGAGGPPHGTVSVTGDRKAA